MTFSAKYFDSLFFLIFDISHFDQKEINSVQEFLLSSYSVNKEQLPVQQNSTQVKARQETPVEKYCALSKSAESLI